jgi:AcrR family transcriptional regulator
MGSVANDAGLASEGKAQGSHPNGLSDVTIARAAREIIGEVGVDGLTMRELSARLGVTLGATYHYLSSRDAVIQRVARDLFEQVEKPSFETGTWREQVKSLVLATATTIGQYPGMASYVLAHVDEIGPLRIHEEMMGILKAAGLDERHLHALMGALFFYGSGIAATLLSVRQAEQFEHVDVEAMFGDGLDMMLAGAQLRLDRRFGSPESRPRSQLPWRVRESSRRQ